VDDPAAILIEVGQTLEDLRNDDSGFLFWEHLHQIKGP